MSPKRLFVLLDPALLLLIARYAGAEAGTPQHAVGLGAVSSVMSSWNKQGGLPRGAPPPPPVDGVAPRCSGLSSQALCVRARGGGVLEVRECSYD